MANICDKKNYLHSFEYSKHSYVSEDMITMLIRSITFESIILLEENENKRKLFNQICADFNQHIDINRFFAGIKNIKAMTNEWSKVISSVPHIRT